MPRKRAINVCESCHDHKIRCDVDSTGVPCSKCVELGDDCKLRTRKQYKNRKRQPPADESKNDSGDEHHVTESSTLSINPDPIKIVAAAMPELSSRTAPIFIGDGGYGSILDATGDVPGRHFHVPAAAEKTLAPEDLEYLKIKGCFSLPAESVELVMAYFQFVHPTFPVVDGPAFLKEYVASGVRGINLLLLWSMFSVSASYVPISSRRIVKESFVHRAKLLFDLSQETDKIVLVQSALLLSFWFVDTEDVKQSWYWTSIAFSIAQTLGLHRQIKSAHGQVNNPQQSLWRNIWSCCMIRDVWLAFGMGRPLRINISDCDALTSQGFDCKFEDLMLHDSPLYSPAEAAGFASMWKNLITTSTVLRSVLAKEASSPTQLRTLQSQINVGDSYESTFLLARAERHLRLHQYAALIALARASSDNKNTKGAADATTSVLEALLNDNTALYASPVTVPLLVPAMVTYLAAIKSPKPNVRDQAKEKLGVYTRFLSAIEANYPAASILKRVHTAAQDSILGNDHTTHNAPEEFALVAIVDNSPSSWHFDWSLEIEQSFWLPGIDGPGLTPRL